MRSFFLGDDDTQQTGLVQSQQYRNTRYRCEVCSKLTRKTPEQRQWRHSGVFIVNFENISHFFSGVSIVNFEQVNDSSVRD